MEGALKMKIKKTLFLTLLLVCIFIFASVSSANQANWDGSNEIIVIGYGVAPPFATTQAQATILARRAAVADAHRQLGEIVEHVLVDSENKDIIRTRMSAVIQGSAIILEEATAGGLYKVIMVIDASNMLTASGQF